MGELTPVELFLGDLTDEVYCGIITHECFEDFDIIVTMLSALDEVFDDDESRERKEILKNRDCRKILSIDTTLHTVKVVGNLHNVVSVKDSKGRVVRKIIKGRFLEFLGNIIIFPYDRR